MHPRAKTDLTTLAICLLAGTIGTLVVLAAGGRLGVALSVGVMAFSVALVSRLAFERLGNGETRPESRVSEKS